MKVTDALYTYGIRDKKVDKILRKIRHGKKVCSLYVIVLPLLNDGILEIYGYNQLLQPFYRNMSDSICIVGIAKGKDGALSLVQDMIQDMYDSADGDSDIFNTERFFGFVS